MLYHGCLKNGQGFYFSLVGLATGTVLLLPFCTTGGMEFGDLKLLGAVGSVIGGKAVFFVFFFAALFGGVYAAAIIIRNWKNFKSHFKKLFHIGLAFLLMKKYKPGFAAEKRNRPKLHYGLAIALGTFVYMGLSIAGYNIGL